MKNNNIKPNGLKGNEKLNRMLTLMNIKPITESTIERSETLLTKKGPDGKFYAIIKENHEYFIKTSNVVSEGFDYIGGLKNKRDKVFPSYAKAIKHLNLSFISLAESTGEANTINSFAADEIEENVEVVEEEATTGIVRGMGHDKHIMEVDEEMTDNEKSIDEMVTGENSEEDEEAIVENFMKNNNLKIGRALEIVENDISRETSLQKLIGTLSPSEASTLIEALKKKV